MCIRTKLFTAAPSSLMNLNSCAGRDCWHFPLKKEEQKKITAAGVGRGHFGLCFWCWIFLLQQIMRTVTRVGSGVCLAHGFWSANSFCLSVMLFGVTLPRVLDGSMANTNLHPADAALSPKHHCGSLWLHQSVMIPNAPADKGELIHKA